ncbi:unnamed protein product [Cylicocyclus nassatus]|uniref:Uncharacterized protein n=1 Tax=Cylicocyclus nassatus TaxID=53992 RepID=A0AA36GG19_CYLNA|nr:unnamed protein product [Cylicocyclus nassatus]
MNGSVSTLLFAEDNIITAAVAAVSRILMKARGWEGCWDNFTIQEWNIVIAKSDTTQRRYESSHCITSKKEIRKLRAKNTNLKKK